MQTSIKFEPLLANLLKEEIAFRKQKQPHRAQISDVVKDALVLYLNIRKMKRENTSIERETENDE